MWIHINLIMIGMLTIFVPCLYFTSPNAPIILSTFLFFAGMYLTTIYFIMFYYKETKEKLEKENKMLKKEIEKLTNNETEVKV